MDAAKPQWKSDALIFLSRTMMTFAPELRRFAASRSGHVDDSIVLLSIAHPDTTIIKPGD